MMVTAMLLVTMLLLTACAVAKPSTTEVTSSEPTEQPVAEATEAPATEPAKPVEAYFVGITAGGAAWGAAQKGFEDACAELGWNGYYVAPTTANDTAQMVTLTETAITNGAQVIIGTYYSADIFGDAIGKAREKGIYVASTNCYMSPELQDFWIGTVPAGMGLAQAKTLVELAGGEEVTVVYIQTLLTAETQNAQFKVFAEYLADYPNITVFGQDQCNSDPVAASDKLSALIKANPEINAVVCADSYGAVGIANYIDESGIKDSFISIGIDDSAELLSFVKSGALDCTIAQDFYAMGYKSTMMLNDVMNGKTYPYENDSGVVVIMPANVEAIAAEKGYTLTD